MKLAICDDMENFCTYYKKLFSRVEDVTVAGTANNGEQCIEMVKKTMPDVLMLDIQMQTDSEGVEIIETLLKIEPSLKIVMITVHEIEDYIFRAFALGAKDFIYKTASDDEVITKVMNVYHDNVMLNSYISNILASRAMDAMRNQKSMLYILNQIGKLSKSELSVLRGVYYGKKYRDIARDRYVEEGTIRAQASGILKKMNTTSMRSLVKDMKDLGVFEFIDLYGDEKDE